MEIGKIEDISGLEGRDDVISYFGCLLYVDRKNIPEVLKSSMNLLIAGGVLVIHENPKGVIKPGSSDYNICFETEELINYVSETAGSPVFYNMLTPKNIPRDKLQDKVIMAIVKKV